MLDKSELDAVLVGTPMPYHAMQSIMALDRGVNVLCEVPAAVSVEECVQLVEAQQRSKAIYMMAENYCYTWQNVLVREVSRAGLFGDLYYGVGEYVHELKQMNEDTPWRRHMDRVVQHVDVDRIRARRFRVALDGVNGAGSRMSVWFLSEILGCELHAIHVDPTKTFPREAEPKPETLGELRELVKTHACDVGFGQDPDGDRLAACDGQGEMLDNDDMLALAVEAALSRKSGDVVVNLTTSSVIDEVTARFGGRVYRTAVGEANVVERMRAVNAVIGGEGSSGGVIFAASHLCRDSYIAMALLLDRMASSGQTLAELSFALPRYHRRGGKVQFAHGKLGGLMLAMEKAHPGAQLERTDGLKLSFAEGWIHLRSSNTEPLLRVAVESKSEEVADRLFAESMTLLRS